jgi:hypothetical protein
MTFDCVELVAFAAAAVALVVALLAALAATAVALLVALLVARAEVAALAVVAGALDATAAVVAPVPLVLGAVAPQAARSEVPAVTATMLVANVNNERRLNRDGYCLIIEHLPVLRDQ